MNINMLMQQAQRMQKDMESNLKKAKEELANTEVHAEAGGGLVKVTMTCRNVVKVQILVWAYHRVYLVYSNSSFFNF